MERYICATPIKVFSFVFSVFLTPGPSSLCIRYDFNVLLKEDDIKNLVAKINKRRNFIALGHSKSLPRAANMNKIEWSQELADIAQRWVDQCDSSADEDDCRDLTNMQVGQSISTVVGPSSHEISVHNFVETWFMQILEYNGTISYYNESRDQKSKYFTQLIWAETKLVGCGKAKYYGHKGYNWIEKLVCNFAPKGNIHSKPVYAVGIPATQCGVFDSLDSVQNMRYHHLDNYPGLCNHTLMENFTKKIPTISSLLRILNLSNDSAIIDIDPLRNVKESKSKESNHNEQRSQKIRHVPYSTYGGIFLPMRPNHLCENVVGTISFITRGMGIVGDVKHSSYDLKHCVIFFLCAIPPVPPAQTPNFGLNSPNISKRFYHHDPEKGHSRIFHSHDHGSEFKGNIETQDFRKYNFATTPMNSQAEFDFRRQQGHQECTRKQIHDYSQDCVTGRCTRKGNNDDCQSSTQPCQQVNACARATEHFCPPDSCSCNTQKNTCPATTRCTCNMNCQCHSMKCPTNIFTHVPEQIQRYNSRKSAEIHYYDLLPRIPLRSGDIVTKKFLPTPLKRSNKNIMREPLSHITRKIESDIMKVTDVFKFPKSIEDHDYLYDSFDYSERKRRTPEDQVTFKPFWQMDEFSFKKPIELKALKYTTLSNLRNKKNRKTALSAKIPSSTESITIKLKETSSSHGNSFRGPFTEKFLSFEELMHLRKLTSDSGDYKEYNKARRQGEDSALRENSNQTDTTTEKTTTTVITANTPFIRKKHCTRKLTCTWTSPTMTDADGHVINGGGGGGGGNVGSRTPPGYVDGCTRTSTCTREHMDRNKMPTEDASPTETTPEDEDYCEKRSLNRRNSDEDTSTYQNYFYQEAYTMRPISTTHINENIYPEVLVTTSHICKCKSELTRLKRGSDLESNMGNEVSHSSLTYGELFYLVLNKIIQTLNKDGHLTHSGECACNEAYLVKCYSHHTMLLILIYYIYL